MNGPLKRVFPLILLAAFFAAASAPLAAQDIPERIQEPSLQQNRVIDAGKAADQSQKQETVEGAEVTYDQVLEHPDDVELNYRFALAQVRKGNLRSASATLERILMVDPGLPKVRLVYAIVLFRLDNLEDAQRELEAIKAKPMPDSLRAELEVYLREIRRRRRRTHYGIVLGVGLDYDDNRNAAPAKGERLFFDTPITLDKSSTRKGDAAKTMLASFSVKRDLSQQAGHSLFADYSYYRAEQTNQRILNLQNHFFDAGFTYRASWADITPSVELDHLLLTQTTYLRSRGGRLRLDHKITPRFGSFMEGAYIHQDYNRTLVVPTGDQRTGDRAEGTGGLSYVLTPTMSLLGSYMHVHQGAAAKFDAYDREAFNLVHTWLLGRGRFLLTSATVNVDRYEKPEITVSRTNRYDHTYRGRVTFGAPLQFLPKPLNGLIWTVSCEYYHALSSLTNYAYSNNKVSTFMTYKWSL